MLIYEDLGKKEFCAFKLGSMKDRIGLENARLTGDELAIAVQKETGARVSNAIATCALRAFRLEILDGFFGKYPMAAYVPNWHEVADMVAIFTRWQCASYCLYSHKNYCIDACWRPKRAAILDAVQKLNLIGLAHTAKITNAHFDKILRWKADSKWRQKKIKPLGRADDCLEYNFTISCRGGGSIPWLPTCVN